FLFKRWRGKSLPLIFVYFATFPSNQLINDAPSQTRAKPITTFTAHPVCCSFFCGSLANWYIIPIITRANPATAKETGLIPFAILFKVEATFSKKLTPFQVKGHKKRLFVHEQPYY